jgi:hypothetical protein
MTDETGNGKDGSETLPYKVGRGRPPQHSRWRKGQSGNAKGRPSGSLNVKTVLTRVVEEMRVPLTENGSKRDVNILEALLKREAHEGINGKLSAIQSFMNRAERLLPSTTHQSEPDLLAEDEAILKRALHRKSTPGRVNREAGLTEKPALDDEEPSSGHNTEGGRDDD